RPPGLRARHARYQDEGDVGARLLAGAPLRRLRHLSRGSVRRGGPDGRRVPGNLRGGAGRWGEHRHPPPPPSCSQARGSAKKSVNGSLFTLFSSSAPPSRSAPPPPPASAPAARPASPRP